jgi:cytochrome c oxidase subunit 2
MHLHKFEKIWLIFSICCLILFLTIIGVSAFSFDHHPSGGSSTIDPERVHETPPFDSLGVTKIDEDTYEVAVVAMAFSYQPNTITVPVDKKIIFNVTSTDVTHSFSIVNTNVNMMVVPGLISTKEYTFKETGHYLIVCNEYCGAGHHYMSMEIEVVSQ